LFLLSFIPIHTSQSQHIEIALLIGLLGPIFPQKSLSRNLEA
ncbi:hypothetical protein LINPERHAP1_LOCUS21735, partial [Linum perenne]